MSKENGGVTHKELLVFTNLTNLEWEFTNLEESGEEERNSNQLNELLDPELFYREDEEENEFGDNVNYIYGERDNSGNYKKEEGLREMREAAGIAMEYREKDTEEAKFLEKWEVIYGAEKSN